MQLTNRQKLRLRIRFWWLFYDIVTRSSLYFIVGLVFGFLLTFNQLIKSFESEPFNQLIQSCYVDLEQSGKNVERKATGIKKPLD